MADILLIILGFVLLVAGVIGCILPVLPGPPISFVALLALHFAQRIQFTSRFLWIMAIIALVVTILDYIVPVWGAKKFGGSAYGTRGATVGLIIGLFLGPLGIIIGPFVGAVVAERMSGRNSHEALRSGIGAFIGFLLGVGLKLMASFLMAFYFIKELIVSFF